MILYLCAFPLRVIRYVISWAHSAITSYVNYSACTERAGSFGAKTPRGGREKFAKNRVTGVQAIFPSSNNFFFPSSQFRSSESGRFMSW